MLGPPMPSIDRRRKVLAIGAAASGDRGTALAVATGPGPATAGDPGEAAVPGMSGVDPPTEPPMPATADTVSFGMATPSMDATARPRTSVMYAGFCPGTFCTVVSCRAGATSPVSVLTGCRYEIAVFWAASSDVSWSAFGNGTVVPATVNPAGPNPTATPPTLTPVTSSDVVRSRLPSVFK